MRNILIHCAMEKEGKQIAEKLGLREAEANVYRRDNISLIISGMGKELTMMAVSKYLVYADEKSYDAVARPDLIINIGYAGSTDLDIGTWVCISKAYNYEWNIPGEERYSMKVGDQELQLVNDMMAYPCYTSESFVESTDITDDVVFDMELHALAVLADTYKIPLVSLKKISDNLSLDEYYKSLDKDEIFELISSIEILEKNKLLK